MNLTFQDIACANSTTGIPLQNRVKLYIWYITCDTFGGNVVLLHVPIVPCVGYNLVVAVPGVQGWGTLQGAGVMMKGWLRCIMAAPATWNAIPPLPPLIPHPSLNSLTPDHPTITSSNVNWLHQSNPATEATQNATTPCFHLQIHSTRLIGLIRHQPQLTIS